MYQDKFEIQDKRIKITAETFVFRPHERLNAGTFEVFIEGFNEYLQSVEDNLQQLDENSTDETAINGIFRTLHTLKGDCFMCFMEPLGIYVHTLEDGLSGLRSKRIEYNTLLRDAFLAALDLVAPTVETMALNNSVDAELLAQVACSLQKLSCATAEEQDSICVEIIHRLGGDVRQLQKDVEPLYPLQDKNEQLAYFCSLSTLLENRNPRWKNRTCSIAATAIEINNELQHPVDEQQLEAAVYLHDVGMAFFSDELIDSASLHHPDQQSHLLIHPDVAAQMLSLMPGWRDAAEIVLQHHERPDGNGYPLRLTSDHICIGAKILAIATYFDQLVNARDKFTNKHSVLKAAAEINVRKGTQFDPDIVDAFNRTVNSAHGDRETPRLLH